MVALPSVPNVPGVPPLFRPFGTPVLPPPTLALSDARDLPTDQQAPQWGIFLDGVAVVLADNVLDFAFRQDWELSTYPQEEGAFQTYNKVVTPYDARVTFSAGGSNERRQAFLASITSIAGDLNLYDVVTPELIYSPTNIAHFDYRRQSDNGVGLVVVDVWLKQIRIAAAPTFSQTKTPSGTASQNGGTVAAVPPTPAQQSALSSMFGP